MTCLNILILGLWIIPFFRWGSAGLRTPKEFFFLGISMALGLLSLRNTSRRPFHNEWLFFLGIYGFISLWNAPQFHAMFFGASATNFWAWKTLMFQIVAILAVVGISRIKISDISLMTVQDAIVIPAAVTASYMVLQYIGIDQFFTVISRPDIADVTRPQVAGAIGQPTLASPYLAMAIPFAWHRRRFFCLGLLCLGLLCADSMMAYFGAAAGTLFLLGTRPCKTVSTAVNVFIVFAVLAGTIGYAGYRAMTSEEIQARIIQESNGRLTEWPQIIHDWMSPPLNEKTYQITGMGPGAFSYLYAPRKHSIMRQAHNEYLEFLYNEGIAGMILLFFAVKAMLSRVNLRDPEHRTAMASLVSIAVCATGTFVWQVGVTQLVTVVLIGLLHNEDFLQGEVYGPIGNS